MKKTLQVSNILALVITLVMNYLSNTGVFNGNTMASVSARYQNYFTPAGYAFSIWGLIYIALAGFVIYQAGGISKPENTPGIVSKIGWAFVISCVANCLWILAWLYDYTSLSVLIMIVLLLSLIRIVIHTRMELDLITFKRVALEWWPFAIYLGWISVALIANIAAWLTKIQWSGWGISPINWTIIMISAATVVNLLLIWTRNLRESASVGVWALLAIAVANWNGEALIVNAAIVASVIIFINISIHGYRNRANPFIIER